MTYIKKGLQLKVSDHSWARFFPAPLKEDVDGEMGMKRKPALSG